MKKKNYQLNEEIVDNYAINAAIESEEQQKLRWQVELEFVQCLANPNYLNFLAQRGYFKDHTFINYLKYLQYWKEPEYAKYLMYPMSLYFLDLLQYEHFRREIVNSQCCKFIDDQAILQWQHYTRKRIKMFNSANSGGMNQMNAADMAATDPQQQQHHSQPHQVQHPQGSGGGVTNTPTSVQNGLVHNQVQLPQLQQLQAQQQQTIANSAIRDIPNGNNNNSQ